MMRSLRVLLSRLGELLLRRAREQRLSDEIAHHIDMLAAELAARGMPPAQARLEARRQFGNIASTQITHRDQRGFAWLDDLWQDVRFGCRLLTRERGFALTAIVVLGVGIGVNHMFFTLLWAHKFRGLPIAGADRIVSLSVYDERVPQRALSLDEFDELRAALTTVDRLSAHAGAPVTVGDEGRAPDRFEGAYVSAGSFEALGIAPLLGTLPSADHDRHGATPVAMLGATAWRLRYHADPTVLGRAILINGSPATVVAVVPDRSGFPSNASIWLPLGQWPGMQQGRDARALQVFGRLRDTVTEADAQSEVDAWFGRRATLRPDTNHDVRPRLQSINERVFGDLRGWEAFIVAGVIVILVAAANVANLMLVRSMRRAPEIAIRTSLGASRLRIVRQLLIEAAVIAAVAGLLGGMLSVAGVRLFQSAIPEGTLPYWFHYEMDGSVLTGLVIVSIGTIAVFGLIPALQASRTDVNRTLKDGGRTSTGQARARLWTVGFLAVELALAMILLSQIAVTSLRANTTIPTDASIRTTAVMTATVTLPGASYPTPERRGEFYRRLDERLRARPEIVAVSRTTLLPGAAGFPLRRVTVEGRAPNDEPPGFTVIEVAPSYLSTMALSQVQGRDFHVDDSRGQALVNQRFVEVALHGANPIGVRISVDADGTAPRWRTIIGVLPTIRQQGGGGAAQQALAVYVPIDATQPVTSMLMVRHQIAPEAAAQLLREEVRGIDPNVPLYRMNTLQRAVDDAQWNGRLSNYLGYTVCMLSALLAIVGLYAVTSQSVALRTQEIAVRVALGAGSTHVARLVLRGLAPPLLLGLFFGATGTMAWDRAFSSGVRDLYAAGGTNLITITALLIGVVAVACFIPLRRAIRVDPVAALRHD